MSSLSTEERGDPGEIAFSPVTFFGGEQVRERTIPLLSQKRRERESLRTMEGGRGPLFSSFSGTRGVAERKRFWEKKGRGGRVWT